MAAMAIIDSCDYAELRPFNAPLLANQTISIGQQIEMYSNGSESEERRRNGNEEENAGGKRKRVVERVISKMVFWKKVKLKRVGRGGGMRV